MKTPRFALANIAILFATIVAADVCLAGTKVNVGQNVPTGQQVSMDQIDHQPWDGLLKRYVDSNGMVAYAQWKQSAPETQMLNDYLASLSSANPSAQASPAAQLAFWINAYNALTVYGILREYPTTSIRNHTAKVIGYNIWDDLLLNVGGKAYSLNQMEHEVLRKIGEPRIHFAIVCASIGCPRLLAEAYTAEQLDAQLTTNSQAFFANSANFQYIPNQRKFQLSSIMEWFGGDFGSDQTSQLSKIAPYLPTREAQDAAMAGSVTVSYLEYDWGLNDQAKATAARR